MSRTSPSHSDETESAEELNRRAKNAFLWVGSTTAVWQIVTWIFTVYTARLLNPDDYGLIALAETVNPYLALLCAMNVPTWMIQVKEFPEKDQKAIFSLCLLSGVVMTVVSAALAQYVGQFYDNEAVVLPLQIMSITFLLRSIGALPDSLLRREMRFKSISVMNVTVGFLRGCVQLILAIQGFGYWALVAGLLFKETAECLWLIAVRGLPRGLGWDTSLFRRALGFGVPATFATIAWIIYSSADAIIVGKMFGVQFLGIYGMAKSLIEMPLSKLNTVVRPIVFPYFSRLAHIPGALEYSFLKVVRLITAVTFPMMLGIAAVSDSLIPLILGGHWIEMVPTMRVLCVAWLIKALMDNLSVLFLSIGRPNLVLYFNILGMCTLPPAFFAAGTYWGINGIYGTWLILLPLLAVVNLAILKRVTGIGFGRFLLNSKAPLVASVCMVGAVYLVKNATSSLLFFSQGSWTDLTAQIAIGGLSYAGVFYLLFPRDLKDLIASKKEISAPVTSSLA